MDIDRLIAERPGRVDISGIRRVFNLAARLEKPINLSIGQPDFPVDPAIKRAACDAILNDTNGYTLTQGLPDLTGRIGEWLRRDVGWDVVPAGTDARGETGMLVTAGTSGALTLLFLTLLDPGDEAIIADPYFVAYPHLATMCDATVVPCDTYPDFRLTAERVEPLITDRTKFVLANSPSNPSGVVSTSSELAELHALCRARGVLLISDEIYDEFVYEESRTEGMHAEPSMQRAPSPGRIAGAHEDVVLIRGFGKSYAVTGWRLGYVAGPRAVIEAMAKIQQYTFVCAPAPLQAGIGAAFDADVSEQVASYQRRRDRVVERLAQVTDLATPGGAFYAFPRIPEHLGLDADGFIERCIERSVLVIPGTAFSDRSTHFRLSFATSQETLEAGLDVLVDLLS